MAAPMNFCPGGAEFDDDDDDGFVFECDDTKDEAFQWKAHDYSVIYATAMITEKRKKEKKNREDSIGMFA
jgi:hypothetical protein